MLRKLVIAAVAISSAAAGLISGRAGGVPVASVETAAPVQCATVPTFARGASPGLATGSGLWAVAGGRLVSVSEGRSVEPSTAPAGAIVKHLAVSEGSGSAYVVDRAGDDDVVVTTPDGTRRLHERAEVSHPAWSTRGDLAWATGTAVAVLDDETRSIERMRSPVRGATVFSPVFLSATRLAAVVSSPPTARVPEGERLGNLWVTRIGTDEWHRLTTFEAGKDRWVTVRTPIVHAERVHFVKIVGRGSATRQPRFELWRVDHGVPRRVRRLPEERYLAGSRGARLLWNVPDPATGRQALAVDGPDGLRVIGCGSVMVEPFDAVDPDRSVLARRSVPPRGEWPELEAPASGDAEEIAVIVGDFPTSAEAATVAEAIRAAFPGAQVQVVDSSIAPVAIRPGVFGALLHLAQSADPTTALASFRSRLPQYSSNSWIVTP